MQEKQKILAERDKVSRLKTDMDIILASSFGLHPQVFLRINFAAHHIVEKPSRGWWYRDLVVHIQSLTLWLTYVHCGYTAGRMLDRANSSP